MPSSTQTERYPLWLKQALYAILDDPSRLPLHLPFDSTADSTNFKRLFYGYQKALAIEEAAMEINHRKAPDSYPPPTSMAKDIAQIMLRKAQPFERKGDEPEQYILCWRDHDPRTKKIADLFAPLIAESEERALGGLSSPDTHSPQHAEPSMEDMLSQLGYNNPAPTPDEEDEDND